MSAAKLIDANLLIFGAPQEKFSMAEVRLLDRWTLVAFSIRWWSLSTSLELWKHLSNAADQYCTYQAKVESRHTTPTSTIYWRNTGWWSTLVGSECILLRKASTQRPFAHFLHGWYDWWPDAVTRTVYYKYFHPKEVYVTSGVLNREINRAAGKLVGGVVDHSIQEAGRYNSKYVESVDGAENSKETIADESLHL